MVNNYKTGRQKDGGQRFRWHAVITYVTMLVTSLKSASFVQTSHITKNLYFMDRYEFARCYRIPNEKQSTDLQLLNLQCSNLSFSTHLPTTPDTMVYTTVILTKSFVSMKEVNHFLVRLTLK
jgi:hypothetical protein